MLTLCYPTERRFDVAERGLLETFAELCAQSLERVRLAQHEDSVAVSLQRAMMGRVDDVAGVRTAVAYRPCDVGMRVGGDW